MSPKNMAVLTRANVARLGFHLPRVSKVLVAMWLVSFGVLTTLLVLLTVAIMDSPAPSQDVTVMAKVTSWDVPGIAPASSVLSFLTNNWPGMGLGVGGVLLLWLLGMSSTARSLAIVGGIIGAIALGADVTLGEIVSRARPLEAESGPAFPSGHTFGSTVLFGVLGFLAVYYKVKRRYLVPLLVALAATTLAVGFSRIFEQSHWPSDVAAGYLLGGITLLWIVPFYLFIQRFSWISSPDGSHYPVIVACESCRIERSIASTVILDPEQGTATKIYRPPRVVRLLYWIAFQAKFPYETNMVALQAAGYRRMIASMLTIHRFGKDLVAHVTAVSCVHGGCALVTEFVPGEKVENDEATRQFLTQVARDFSEAGLSVWQVNPRNPHAHTNVIRTPVGDLKIVDLESAVVTPFPAPGQWRSAFRRGSIPVFDDIDFGQLRRFMVTNEATLLERLGDGGLAELEHAIKRGEETIATWKGAEPRVWGRLIGRVYRLLAWKTLLTHLAHALHDADKAAAVFLQRGMERWEREGRLGEAELASLRALLSSDEAQDALRHMGAHIVLSVAVAVPIPGLRSLARFVWTLAFWVKVQVRGVRRGVSRGRVKRPNIHNPLVMLLALVPIFGAVAYLAARPLRDRLLVRLVLDQAVWALPFNLYTRMHLGRFLAPAPH